MVAVRWPGDSAYIDNVTGGRWSGRRRRNSQTKITTSGANVAIKVELVDASGNDVSAAAIALTVQGLTPGPAPGIAASGNFTFMLLDTGAGYQLNVKTANYPKGTYTLSFTAGGDPTIHAVQFVIG